MDHTSPTPFRLLTLAVFITLLICFTFIDLGARDDFVKLNKNVDQIAKSIEAIDHAQETTQKASLRGDGILSKLTCMPDLRCPYMQRTWEVPLTPGDEQLAMKEILQRAGYTLDAGHDCMLRAYSDCYVDGSNAVARIGMTIVAPTSGTPSRDVPPNLWRRVIVNANLK